MKVITYEVPSLDLNLFLLSDIHKGSRLCYWTGVKKALLKLQNPYFGLSKEQNKCAFLGDALEGITIDDKRFSPDGLSPKDLKLNLFPLKQCDEIIETFQPLKNHMVVWLEGNHEFALKSFGNIAEYMADKIGVEYGTYSCVVQFMYKGELLFKAYFTHGRKGIRSSADDESRREANEKLMLKRHLRDQMSDCILQAKGHSHKLLILKPKNRLQIYSSFDKIKQTYIQTQNTGQFIHPDDRWYVNTGGFYRLYGEGFSGYAERLELSPIELGFPVVLIRNGKILDVIPETV